MAITPESILFGSQFFRWCQDNGETIVIQHETVLIEEGRITPNLYLVLEGSGQVRTTRESEDEGTSSIELAVIGAGQFVGEMSLLEDRLPVATVIALPDSHWIRINYKRLVSAAKDKQLAVSTYQVFAESSPYSSASRTHSFTVGGVNVNRYAKYCLSLGSGTNLMWHGWPSRVKGWSLNSKRRLFTRVKHLKRSLSY